MVLSCFKKQNIGNGKRNGTNEDERDVLIKRSNRSNVIEQPFCQAKSTLATVENSERERENNVVALMPIFWGLCVICA
jgi:hypothetical protein